MNAATDIELAWAAGLFEGEGCVAIVRGGRRGYTRLVVTVQMTDRSCVQFFQDRWPGSKIQEHKRTNPKHRTKFGWWLSAAKAVAFIHDVLPFIRSDRVRRKMLLAIESQAARRRGSRDPDYLDQHRRFHFAMRELNARGTGQVEMGLPMYQGGPSIPLLGDGR